MTQDSAPKEAAPPAPASRRRGAAFLFPPAGIAFDPDLGRAALFFRFGLPSFSGGAAGRSGISFSTSIRSFAVRSSRSNLAIRFSRTFGSSSAGSSGIVAVLLVRGWIRSPASIPETACWESCQKRSTGIPWSSLRTAMPG